MVPLKIVLNVSRFKPARNLNRVLADLNRGSNSLNSISDLVESSTVDPLSNTAIFKLEIDLIADICEVVKCKPYVDLSQLVQ